MFFRYHTFSIAWAVFIFVLSVVPSQTFPDFHFNLISVDKLAHAMVYMILVFFLIVGFLKQHRYVKLRFNATKLSIIIASAYGILLEVVQALLPDRYFALDDMVANTIGCFFGAVLYFVVYKL